MSPEPDKHPIFENLERKLYRWFWKCLLVVLCVWFVLVITSRILRSIALSQIADLTYGKVESESVEFSFNGSILIKGLVITPDYGNQYDDTILKAETVYARFGVGSLLLLKPRLKKISISDFVFNAQYDQDSDRWNLSALKIKPLKDPDIDIPIIYLKGGTLQYSRVSNSKAKIAIETPLDLSLEPAEKKEDGYIFEIITAKRDPFRKSQLSGIWRTGNIAITGGISSRDIPAFEKTWIADVFAAELEYDKKNDYSLNLRIKDLLIKGSPPPVTAELTKPSILEEFVPSVFLQKLFQRYRPAGLFDIELQAQGNFDKLSESVVKGQVFCKDSSACYYKFDYPVEHMTGKIDFTEKGVSLNRLLCWHNDVKLTIDGWSRRVGANYEYQVGIASDNMLLDNDLCAALNQDGKNLWSAFSPSGRVAIDYTISRNQQTGNDSSLNVKLLGTEARYHSFPYPLKNLTGNLVFNPQIITIRDIVSESEGHKIKLNGEVIKNIGELPIYDIQMDAENIRMDSTLIEALGPNWSDFCSRFDTTGSVSIENITGQFWSGRENNKPCYRLSINKEQVELDDNLFSILPVQAEKIISELHPSGVVNVKVDLEKIDTNDAPDYRITIDRLNNISFDFFPYPLKNITGQIVITSNEILVDNITAAAVDKFLIMQDTSTIKIDGQILLDDNSFKVARFQLLANDIFFDKQLGFALPEDIEPFYTGLAPVGMFDLNLKEIRISYPEDINDGEKYIDFDADVKFKNCGFDTTPDITELDAVLETRGSYKIGSGFCSASSSLAVDNVRIMGKSLTNLKADIDYDSDSKIWRAGKIVADSYGGKVSGKFELKQSNQANLEYQLNTGFNDLNLKQFLSDRRNSSDANDHNGYTSGKMNGSLSVGGRFGDNTWCVGRCKLAISDMQVGKLSPFAKLLAVLQLNEPTDYAFEEMFVDSYLNRNELFFDKFDLSGKTMAFNGSGFVDLPSRAIDLTLRVRGRRVAGTKPSFWQSLTENLGRAVIRIDVTGDVYEPQFRKTTLPVLSETFRIFGTKIESAN